MRQPSPEVMRSLPKPPKTPVVATAFAPEPGVPTARHGHPLRAS